MEGRKEKTKDVMDRKQNERWTERSERAFSDVEGENEYDVTWQEEKK